MLVLVVLCRLSFGHRWPLRLLFSWQGRRFHPILSRACIPWSHGRVCQLWRSLLSPTLAYFGIIFHVPPTAGCFCPFLLSGRVQILSPYCMFQIFRVDHLEMELSLFTPLTCRFHVPVPFCLLRTLFSFLFDSSLRLWRHSRGPAERSAASPVLVHERPHWGFNGGQAYLLREDIHKRGDSPVRRVVQDATWSCCTLFCCCCTKRDVSFCKRYGTWQQQPT